MNKTCIITGGAKRIGKALCRNLAASGWNIVIHYNQSHQDAKKLKAEILEMGVRVKIFKASFPLENEKQYKKILEGIFSELGSVDLLINNAGIRQRKNFEDMGRKFYCFIRRSYIIW